LETALTVRGLTKYYGTRRAVNSLELEVNRGEVYGLLGHNGAGKTTSIECILGVKRCDAGTIELLGMKPSSDRQKLFEKIGVQFQQTYYQEKIRVEEICEVTSSLYQKPRRWKELLESFGLSGMEKRTVSELSGGERQRLSVIQALIPNPEFVFLDELTTGLDTKARRDVWRYMEHLKKGGLTILLTSHYMDEVEALCDKICILKQGQVVARGTIQEVVSQSPYDNLVEAYLWYSCEEEKVNESI
jgi:ABC-2 type transport system ATP-binding protein